MREFSEKTSKTLNSNKMIGVETLPNQSVSTATAKPTTKLAKFHGHTTWKKLNPKISIFLSKLDFAFNRISSGLWRLVMMGIVFHVAEHFAPELRHHIPIVYQFVDGGMLLVNFIFEWGLKLIVAIFTGRFFSIQGAFQQAVNELITVFTTWITSI